ncbi:phosphatase PAP2 family protein [Rubritalea tangerina]|uniref:Acid phosphatase n=2 Tax=Rubritalea tangerina TaxID=430798 RepID=A0ABW4ZA27_9BACT
MIRSFFFTLTLATSLSASENLVFSNTQNWNPKYLQASKENPRFLNPNWQTRFLPTPPPSNTSSETRKELNNLLKLQTLRTPADTKQIKQEIKPSGHQYLNYFPLSPAAKLEKPHTYQLLHNANLELAKVVFYFKAHFNRVRPSYLETSLRTSIPNPKHPAYPSGHATQAMTFALLLAELQPQQKNALVKSAKSIAHNREIAGVHYASDSQAGFTLAQSLVKEWLQNPDFKTLIAHAQSEW